jgi:hypothetical protein
MPLNTLKLTIISILASSLHAQEFTDLKRLCGALASQGMATRAWRNVDAHYQCISTYKDIGQAGSVGIRSNIAYYVTGDTATKATKVEITGNQNTPESAAAVRQEMTVAVKAWFTAVGVAVPLKLMDAIAAGTAFNAALAKANVKYEVEQNGGVKTLRFTVTPK